MADNVLKAGKCAFQTLRATLHLSSTTSTNKDKHKDKHKDKDKDKDKKSEILAEYQPPTTHRCLIEKYNSALINNSSAG